MSGSYASRGPVGPAVLVSLVGIEGFEPPRSCTQSRWPAKLTYIPLRYPHYRTAYPHATRYRMVTCSTSPSWWTKHQR